MSETHNDVIPPEIYSLYEWECTQDDISISVKFNYPDNFQPDSLDIAYSEDSNSINVSVRDVAVPVLCGVFYEQVQELESTKSEKFASIIIKKKEKKHWKLLIRCKDPESDKIDPKSAMSIWTSLSDQAQNTRVNMKWFQIALSACYLPAIRSYIKELESSEVNAVTYQLILYFYQIAIDQYDDGLSCLNYGKFLIKSNVSEDSVFDIIDMAAQRGLKVAGLQGKVLSRYSNIKFDSKKDISAVEYLLNGIEEDPNDYELYHLLALHYFNGCGVEKNHVEAYRYQEQAKRINENVEDLPQEPSSFPLIIGTIAIGLIGGFTIYKIIKKRN